MRVFDVAAEHGDLIMILRGLPWAEVGPGAHLLPTTEATIQRETALVRERDLELLFAIDPWEPTDRGRLVGDAPGDNFTDPAVVEAYLAYVELVVTRYRPRWLALAVDLDQFAVAQPADVRAFHAAYIRAYRRVKELAPETRVFATFQLEDLQGLLPWGEPHAPQWSLILRFAPVLDVLAFSTFPSFLFPSPATSQPVLLSPQRLRQADRLGARGVRFGCGQGRRHLRDAGWPATLPRTPPRRDRRAPLGARGLVGAGRSAIRHRRPLRLAQPHGPARWSRHRQACLVRLGRAGAAVLGPPFPSTPDPPPPPMAASPLTRRPAPSAPLATRRPHACPRLGARAAPASARSPVTLWHNKGGR